MRISEPAAADKQGCGQSRAKSARRERRVAPFNPFLPGDRGAAARGAPQVSRGGWAHAEGLLQGSVVGRQRGLGLECLEQHSRGWEMGWESPSANEEPSCSRVFRTGLIQPRLCSTEELGEMCPVLLVPKLCFFILHLDPKFSEFSRIQCNLTVGHLSFSLGAAAFRLHGITSPGWGQAPERERANLSPTSINAGRESKGCLGCKINPFLCCCRGSSPSKPHFGH